MLFRSLLNQQLHPGDHTRLVTLCAGCHARVHRTRILEHWLPEIPVALWREWHPDAVEQLQLPVEMSAGAGWQMFPAFRARIVADQNPEDEPGPPDPAQSSFNWPAQTSEGGGARVG